MRAKIPELRSAVAHDDETFRKTYEYTHKLLLNHGSRVLHTETAIEYWQLLLEKRWPSHFHLWLKFLILPDNNSDSHVEGEEKKPEEEKKPVYRVKNIAKDAWIMLYPFVVLTKKDPELRNYDPTGMCFSFDLAKSKILR